MIPMWKVRELADKVWVDFYVINKYVCECGRGISAWSRWQYYRDSIISLVCVFMTFRKGSVICCGLRVDLSGTVVKKNARN